MKIEVNYYGFKFKEKKLYIWMETQEYLNLIKLLGNERISIRFAYDRNYNVYELDTHTKWDKFITLRLTEKTEKEADSHSHNVWLDSTHGVLYTNIYEIKR